MDSFYIYKISNTKTGEYYYGRRKADRAWQKDNYFSSSASLRELCNGLRPTQARLPDWKKEVLLTFDNMEELIEYEEVVVGDRWKTDSLCLNRVPGGSTGGSVGGQILTKEHKAKITDSNKEYWNTAEGRKQASDLGKRAKGKKKTISGDFKKAQSDRSKGRKWINDGTSRKFVKKDEVDSYLNKGWFLGNLKKGKS